MRWPSRTFIVASIVLAFLLSNVAQSTAACGGYCEARQVRAICRHAVSSQELKAQKRDAEFERCASDPRKYLAQTVQGGAQLGWD
jgi:hypothetical protein